MPFDFAPHDPFEDDDRKWLDRVLGHLSLRDLLLLLVAIAERRDDGSMVLREPWRRP